MPAHSGLFMISVWSLVSKFTQSQGEIAESLCWIFEILPFCGDAGRRPVRSALHGRRGSALSSQMPQPATQVKSLPPIQRAWWISILNVMDEDDPIDEISRIEAELEELAEVSERCRKIIFVSKAAIAGGVALPLFMMLGLFGSNQVAAIGSIAGVLGGIVSLGSNVSTLRQTMAATSAAEAIRSDLISRIDLRVVGDRAMKRILT
jgi:hypothetical protein